MPRGSLGSVGTMHQDPLANSGALHTTAGVLCATAFSTIHQRCEISVMTVQNGPQTEGSNLLALAKKTFLQFLLRKK
jgi:hypothetical protein